MIAGTGVEDGLLKIALQSATQRLAQGHRQAIVHPAIPRSDHGETSTFAKVGYTILCPVCEAAGLFLRETPNLDELPLKSYAPHPTMVVHG